MNNLTRREHLIQNQLPWVIAGVMLLLYLLTISTGITLANLGMVSQLSGWSWQQNSLPSVTLLLTYPLRWLPATMQTLGLGLFTALGGALTLGLVARSVALLPHDRTQVQRERERSEYSVLTIPSAWLPPVLAVLACGLQFTFWSNAVDGAGVILDALLFAYPVRCLLEFRMDGKESWLTKAALVFGLGMANHWLMVLLLPAFLVALFWIKGVSFFNLGFLGRMALLGLLGMLFCLVSPMAQSMGPGAQYTLGEALRNYFGGLKSVIVALPFRSLWVLGLTSLLPVAVMGIRWASSFGDNSPMGAALAAFMFHVLHALLLVVCLWGAFDSPLSPHDYPRRAQDLHPFFAAQPWLPLYILTALAVGYFSGYFLLVFNTKAKAARHASEFSRMIGSVVVVCVWACLLIVTVGLLVKNLPSIRARTNRTFSELGRTLAANLPKNGAIVLSDDPMLLSLAQASLKPGSATGEYVFLSTSVLTMPPYHEFLHARYPKVWDGKLAQQPKTNSITSAELVNALVQLAETHEIYYLHPSFGYYFERFRAEPHGLVCRMVLYPTNAVLASPVSAELAASNDSFWKQVEAGAFPAVIRELPPKNNQPRDFAEKLLGQIKAKRDPDEQAMLTGVYYSRALNSWGTEVQARGDLAGAAECFQRAQDVNPLNVVAEINAACNQSLRAGKYEPVDLGKGLIDKLNQYRNPAQMLNLNGPFDEPRFCYQEGAFFAQAAHYRQAAWAFSRVKAMMPDEPSAYLWLAQIYNLWQQSDQALALVKAARALPAARTNSPADFVSIEATIYLTKKDYADAEQVLNTAMEKNPDDLRLENTALSLYMTAQQHTNALRIIARQLKRSPDDVSALNNQGVINLQLGRFDDAVAALNRVLEEQPANYTAMLNRAIANLQAGHLDLARRDYETLTVAFPTAYQVYYGLAEIAYRQKEREAAIKNYELYLTNSPPPGDEAKLVQKRLADLKAGASL